VDALAKKIGVWEMRHESDYGPDGAIGLLMTFGAVCALGFLGACGFMILFILGIH
jgi:hypothetical protein